MERVSTYYGDLPILLVAPHGADDLNTDFLVDKISSEMGTFAVINRGWKRDSVFNYATDRADCNHEYKLNKLFGLYSFEFSLPFL